MLGPEAGEFPESLERLSGLFIGQVPSSLGGYLAAPTAGRQSPLVGPVPHPRNYTRTAQGLWAPRSEQIDPNPLDNAKTYITFSDVADGQKIDGTYLIHLLRRVPIREALGVVALCMATIRRLDRGESARKLDRESLRFFKPPARDRVATALKEGSVLHAPQLLMVLAKLILRVSPDEVADEDRVTIPLPALLLVLADSIDADLPDNADPPSLNEIGLEMAANTNFHSRDRVDSRATSFLRRWIEMPAERRATPHQATMEESFAAACKFTINELAAFCVLLWMKAANGNGCWTRPDEYFGRAGWRPDTVQKILQYISLPVGEYRQTMATEWDDRNLAWHFTTITRFPLVRFGDEVLALDPDLVLDRCIDFPLWYDIGHGLGPAGGRATLDVRQAYDEYSERHVGEVFQSIVGRFQAQRVYLDRHLKKAYRGSSVADIAVDYGDAWVVVEVTTTPPQRHTVNASSITGFERDIEMVIEEVSQVSETIDRLRSNPARLTGRPGVRAREFFPVIVLAEGFPNNFIVTGIVRDELRRRGILQEAGIAPVELMTLGDLDVVEAMAEHQGSTLPDLLRGKAASAFRSDSIKNFILSQPSCDLKRCTRVAASFQRFFSYVKEAIALGDLR
ncbi:hypothetical protein [Micromonospora sp. DT63]|uniref:hypothetical protein n=1 Tax=Micromonospora sp. DT63 TaxID=3393441 RepID=UPI003CF57491